MGTVREAVDRLSVIIWNIGNINDQLAVMTLVGPRERAKVVQVVLEIVARTV